MGGESSCTDRCDMDHMGAASREYECKGGLVLYKSRFGTRFMVCGNMGAIEGTHGTTKNAKVLGAVKALRYRGSIFVPPKFITKEAVGTELPRRCLECKNCIECQFQVDSLPLKRKMQSME